MTRKLSYAFAIVLAGTVISLFLPYAEWVGSAPSFTVTICLYDSSNDSIIPARPEYFSVHGTEPEKVVIHVLSETLAEITVPESCAGGTMSFFGTSYRAGPQIIIGVPGYKVRVVKYYHDLNQYKSTVFGRVVELAPGQALIAVDGTEKTWCRSVKGLVRKNVSSSPFVPKCAD